MRRPAVAVAAVLLLAGCSSTDSQADRVLRDYELVVATYGLSVNDLRRIDGVTVEGRPGFGLECLGPCGSVAVEVSAEAMSDPRVALPELLERLGPVIETVVPPSDAPEDAPIRREPGGPSRCGVVPLTSACDATHDVGGRRVDTSITALPGGGYRLQLS